MIWNQRFVRPWIPERIQPSLEARTTVRVLAWWKSTISSQAAASKLANISTRAFVGTGNDIVIAGFILGAIAVMTTLSSAASGRA